MSHDSSPDPDDRLRQTRDLWDAEAPAFDDQPDHGLRDPQVHAAWSALLESLLPPGAAVVLDTGCGTGSLSVVLAELGCAVTAIDLSPGMIVRAEAKAAAASLPITFVLMDAAHPALPSRHFDAIVCRHVLWALPEPDQVLQRWVDLLKPGGRLVLIEGFWHTGAGLHAPEIVDVLPASLTGVTVHDLSSQPELWGGAVRDERSAVTGCRTADK